MDEVEVMRALNHRPRTSPIEEGHGSYRAGYLPSRSRGNSQHARRPYALPVGPVPRMNSPFTEPRSSDSSMKTYETKATSMLLTPLQAPGPIFDTDAYAPLKEFDPYSFDLVAPAQEEQQIFSLEERSVQLFSKEHLKVIFEHPTLLLRFTAFLSASRPQSIPMLVYYLDALKALKALKYANAVAEALDPIYGHDFTGAPIKPVDNKLLEEKAAKAFDELTDEDLPAYIAHLYLQVVSVSITKRITGTLAPHLRAASEGLAEVFCLSDPSRPDNPIVFASEEFHRTTQYGMGYAIGRNCRFLQGPRTSVHSVRRLAQAVSASKEHCEIFLNYRRDGSPFMNLLMIAPLCDSRGKIRYFIGAQVDVSGLVHDCTGLESLQTLISRQNGEASTEIPGAEDEKKDEFQELSEMFNTAELDTVRVWGGRMHREQQDEPADTTNQGASNRPRLLLKEFSPDAGSEREPLSPRSGRLSGIYQNYLLVRPHPSLRILFASPSLRVPGILQTSFMSRIGGSNRVREELTMALAEGRGVTAKVRWLTRSDEEGRNRWLHCTPLLGSNGLIGVWMVVIVDDDNKGPNRRFKQAPPVDPTLSSERGSERGNDDHNSIEGGRYHARDGQGSSLRSSSPNSLLI